MSPIKMVIISMTMSPHFRRITRSCCPLLRNAGQRYISISSSRATIQVELTSKRYPQLRRGNFATLNDDDIGYFRSFLSSSQVCTDRTELDGYNEDWMHMCKGASSLVLKPKTTDDVSRIMSHCDKRHLAVVPQGGNTGLVGGSVPVFDEVVLSTALMNKILDLDEISGVVTCQAGCILETLDDHVAERGLAMPLDLGAKASCHIGGNVSTSAGGLRLIRYGSLHGSVLGLEAVLASGEVLDCMSGMRKDNTGYDLKQLLIGSEGTLGVVTKVAILCPSRPAAVNVALLACNSFADVLKTLQKGKAMLSEILSAFELIDSASMMAVEKYLHLRNPLSSGEFYCLVETSGSHAGHDEEKLTAFLDSVMEEGSVCDGTVAQGITQQKDLWALRERVAEALLREGYTYKYDVSLPTRHFYDIVVDIRRHLAGAAVLGCYGYGHVGDGNVHLNVTTRQYDADVGHRIEPYVFEWVRGRHGSISAEHGLGFKKRDFIHYSKAASAVAWMKRFKTLMDPNGILNPYKTLPE